MAAFERADEAEVRGAESRGLGLDGFTESAEFLDYTESRLRGVTGVHQRQKSSNHPNHRCFTYDDSYVDESDRTRRA